MIEGRPEHAPAGSWGLGRTLLQWFGVLGAPGAWTLLLVFGYGFEEVACSRGSSHWGFGAGTGEAVLFAATAAVAVGALGASLATWRSAQRPEAGDVRGRHEWMGFAGLLVSTLFLALIMFTGFGVTSLEMCRR